MSKDAVNKHPAVKVDESSLKILISRLIMMVIQEECMSDSQLIKRILGFNDTHPDSSFRSLI